jgi:hypothetical protein
VNDLEWDYDQVLNLVNRKTCKIGNDTPVAKRLYDFLNTDPRLWAEWARFNQSKPDIPHPKDRGN